MDRRHFKLRLHRTEVLRRPADATQPIFPLLRKFYRSNFTVEGLQNKDAECDPTGLDVRDYVPPAALPDDVPTTEVMLDLDNPFSYDETHKVLKDGRIVEKDPVTGKWSRRPAGTAKEMWKRLPQLRNTLQLLGPELFSVQELRGVSTDNVDPDDQFAGPYAGEFGNGLEDLDVYDSGPRPTVMKRRTKVQPNF